MSLWNSLSGTVSDNDFNTALGDVQGPNMVNYQLGNAGNMNSIAQGMAQGGTANQQRLINQLQQQAAGNGPSVANAQMDQGIAQAQNNANSMAAANRGAGGLGLRDAMTAGAAAQANAAQQASVNRNQEQMNALGQLGGAVQGQAGTQLGGLGMQDQVNAQQMAANMALNQAQLAQGDIQAQMQTAQNQQNAQGFGNMLGNIGKIAGAAGSIAMM